MQNKLLYLTIIIISILSIISGFIYTVNLLTLKPKSYDKWNINNYFGELVVNWQKKLQKSQNNLNIKHEWFLDGMISGIVNSTTYLKCEIKLNDFCSKENAKEYLYENGEYKLNIFGRFLWNFLFILFFIFLWKNFLKKDTYFNRFIFFIKQFEWKK